ncbi:hypothetical protein D9611_001827 [Ephemerocybe angulata]|uniref:Protein arginine methyltransferase NDUFAF7 n=1 Tax=Ephemerocybe angulata TaxID=980116 RepID=A0A8H5FM46_9AGAR|nr:hypothetical protein D9611_001827 [Tulosesus angulatus]
MADILRTVSKFGLGKSLTGVHLVENSEALRTVQEQKLQASPYHDPPKLHWYNHIAEIPRNPSEYTILVAHEFFDALPIHVLQKQETGWHEVLIASTETESPEPNNENTEVTKSTTRLRRVLSPKPTATSRLLGHSSIRFDNLPVGSTIEVSPTTFRIAHQVGQLLASQEPSSELDAPSESPKESERGVGGCGLIIDYGAAQVFGDSFRAFKEHRMVDPFHLPGECDLTANVDFAYLQEAMSGLVETHGPISQGDFLERMGLEFRVKALIGAAQSEERKSVIQDAAKRLADRSGMGNEYQVFGITSKQEKTAEDVYPFVQASS